MYSFYGGRPGNSFIIIKSFETVSDMVAAFQQGPSYTDVHYDEYVIINTIDKNSEDNGKIYRRGYDFQNAEGGAEYIGTIVGPAGGAPEVQMTTEAEVEHIYQQYKNNQGFDKRFSNNSYTLTNHSLVPGKQGDTFHDEISWHCCSLRDADTKTNTTAYIGFTIPYPVIDFTLKRVDPYTSLIANRIDDGTHPFYEKWQLDIPKGIKGDTFKNLKVEKATAAIQPYDNQRDDIDNERDVLVYQYYQYDGSDNPTPQKIYLGDYNVIKNIDISDTGDVIIDYTHDKVATLEKIFKWITGVDYEENTGNLNVHYNTSPTDKDTFEIKAIKNAGLSADGTLTFNYNNGESQSFPHAFKWIERIAFETEDDEKNNVFTIYYNYGNPVKVTAFTWVKSISIDPKTGKIATVMSDGHTFQSGEEDGGLQLTWITGAELRDGDLILTWNKDLTLPEGETYYNESNKKEQKINGQKIKWISSIERGGTNSDDLIINYNTGNSTVFTGAFTPLPTVENMRFNADNESRKIDIKWTNKKDWENLTDSLSIVTEAAIDKKGNLLMKFKPTPDGANYTYNNTSGWSLVGTFGTEVYNFKDTETTISAGHYFPAILRNNDLYFTSSSTQLISKLITSATATDGLIKVYKTTDNDTEMTGGGINLRTRASDVTIEVDVFGLNFIVNNADATQQSSGTVIPVLVYVEEPIDLAFTVTPPESDEYVEIDWQGRLEQLEVHLDEVEEKINVPEMKIYLLYHNGLTYTDPNNNVLPVFSTMGDCYLISCGNTTILVDGGSAEYLDNNMIARMKQLVGSNKTIPAINNVIISHYHTDHVTGFSKLLNNDNIRDLFASDCRFYLPILPNSASFVDGEDSYSTIQQNKANLETWITTTNYFIEEDIIIYPQSNTSFTFDENNPYFSVRFLNTSMTDFNNGHYYDAQSFNEEINTGTRYNNFCLVTEFKHKNVTFLSPGDIEPAAQHYLASFITKSPDIYKLEHHTFTNQTDPDYLKKINPKIAFVIGRNDQNLDRYSRNQTIQHLINSTDAIIIGENNDRVSTCIVSDGDNVSVTGDGITNKGYVLASPGLKILRNPNTNISLDDYRQAGTYYATGATKQWQDPAYPDDPTKKIQKTIGNAPFNFFFKLIVCTILDSTPVTKAGAQSNFENCVQIAIGRDGTIATRYYWNLTWSNWRYIPLVSKIPSTFSGNFIVQGIMSNNKKQIYCNIPMAFPIDYTMYTNPVTVNKLYMRAYQNGTQIWGNNNQPSATNFINPQKPEQATNAWLTPFGLSLQINYTSGDGFGNAIPNQTVDIEFKGPNNEQGHATPGFEIELEKKSNF